MEHIMIVDDQPFYAAYLAGDLEKIGYGVEVVSLAEEVLIRIEETKPDLVLLDLYLGGFEGFDLLRDIKFRIPHLPVIILSAYDTFRIDPRTERADAYEIKNIDTDKIKEKVSELLRHKPHQGQLQIEAI